MDAVLPGMNYGSGSREPDSASCRSRTVTRLNNLLTRITGKRKVLEKQTKVDERVTSNTGFKSGGYTTIELVRPLF